MAQYVTAKRAQEMREKGLAHMVQPGNYFQTRIYDALSRLLCRDDAKDSLGKSIHPTNPQKSVGVRSKEIYQAKRNGDVIPSEPVSAHVVKKSMPRHAKVRKIAELEHLAEKVEASRAILAESLEV